MLLGIDVSHHTGPRDRRRRSRRGAESMPYHDHCYRASVVVAPIPKCVSTIVPSKR
jgi:hypothetical protein